MDLRQALRHFHTEIIKNSIQEFLVLPNLAEACDRSGLSGRNDSLVVNAVLKDIGLVTDEDHSLIIGRSKIRSERKKQRKKLVEIETLQTWKLISGIYFDGRKDRTLNVEKIGSTQHTRQITEEHIVIIGEPGSIYLGHVYLYLGVQSVSRTVFLTF